MLTWRRVHHDVMELGISGLIGRFGRLTVRVRRARRSLRPHVHPELNLLINSAGVPLVMRVGDHRRELGVGQAMFINPWELHMPVPTGTGDRVLLSFYLDRRWLVDLCANRNLCLPPRGFATMPFTLGAATMSLVTALAYGQTGASPTEVEERMVSDIGEATVTAHGWMQAAQVPQIAPFVGPHVRRALEVIRKHPTAPVDARSLALRIGLSRSHLFRAFREQLGCTPTAVGNALRMEYSIRALEGSAAQVADISDTLGFSAPGHFVNFFSAHMGIAPGRYRQHLVRIAP